ncbi:MAG: bifunctional diaminohydroxyphosphoribosylaminopyrimidine deaminase/5-amino-6-(5-phosphoribosylamino)uracil reductase RibD [Bacteroidota bacterium]
MQLETHEKYMQRCIELARMGAGSVAPNPMVGAVLVYRDTIIGEGCHLQYGQAHAEVNCLQSVSAAHRELIPAATLYVSLEPCAHFGKTPPCTDLIIVNKIPRVVIGCRDPFEQVNGRGIEKLKAAKIDVVEPMLEAECRELNKRFFTFHTNRRPYIILKWAQTANGIIGNRDHSRLLISNELTNRLVHRWRSEEAAVLIGTNTALYDDPSLTTRLWKGHNPLRLVIDMDLRLPANLHILDGSVRTIVFNVIKQEEKGSLLYYRCTRDKDLLEQVCQVLFELNILSVLVEGGATLLQSFLDEKRYDEARIIVNESMVSDAGIASPVTGTLQLQHTTRLQSDTIRFYKPVL